MKTSLQIDWKGTTAEEHRQGIHEVLDAVAALTKVGTLFNLYRHYHDARHKISFLSADEDSMTRLIGAIRHGDRTAFHISYGGDFLHSGDWILRINVSKDKKPFASAEVRFNERSGEVKKVQFHNLPPADRVPLR